MITTLTKSQKLLINQIKNEWLQLAQTQKNITVSDVEKGVEFLYALDGRKKPLILILNNPLQCQYLANIISSKKGSKISSQIRSHIDSQISSEISSQIRSHIDSQISSEISSEIYSHIDSQIDSEIDSEIGLHIDSEIDSKIRSEILIYNPTMGGLSWRSGYMAEFDYYIQSGLLNINSKLKERTNQYIEFLKKGVWDLLVFDNICIISKSPKTKRDDNQRLHSLNSKAVEFLSGYGFYAIHGVLFNEKLWIKVKDRKLNPNELLKLENVDQRFVAINHYGIENMMKELNTKLLNTGKYGNKLYSFMFEDEDIRLLSYPDIDNGKERVAFINPKFKKADEAMANKHNCTLKQYYAMEILK